MKSDSFISIVSIFISLYVIVLSIIGTSKTPVSEEVLSKRIDRQILKALALSISVAVVTITISSLIPDDKEIFVNRILIAINIAFFIYMFVVLFLLCIKNMNAMAKEIDEEKKKNIATENLLKEIRNLMIEIKEK